MEKNPLLKSLETYKADVESLVTFGDSTPLSKGEAYELAMHVYYALNSISEAVIALQKD